MTENDRYIVSDVDVYDNDKKEFVNDFVEILNQQDKRIKELEKEIEQLKKFDDLNKTFFDLFRTAFKEQNKVDDLFNTLKTMQEKQEQDKILFAVEQLEKLLEKTQTLNLMIKSGHYVNEKRVNVVFEDVIEQQISELKRR